MTTIKALIIALVILTSIHVEADWGQNQTEKRTGVYAGIERTYYIHVPANSKKALVFVLHGGGGKDGGKGIGRFTNMTKLAEAKGFIAVFPSSIEKQWNDGRKVTDNGVNDVGFLNQLARHLMVEFNIDQSRVFVAGMSNGGMMTARLACESDVFKAFAMVSAHIPKDQVTNCPLSAHKKPMLMISGTDDKIMPFNGGLMKGEGGEVLSAKQSIQFWAKMNACTPEYSTERFPNTNKEDSSFVMANNFKSCSAFTSLYVVRGGGHSWPGGNTGRIYEFIAGPTNRDISAAEEIWKVFSAVLRE